MFCKKYRWPCFPKENNIFDFSHSLATPLVLTLCKSFLKQTYVLQVSSFLQVFLQVYYKYTRIALLLRSSFSVVALASSIPTAFYMVGYTFSRCVLSSKRFSKSISSFALITTFVPNFPVYRWFL